MLMLAVGDLSNTHVCLGAISEEAVLKVNSDD